MLCLLAVIRLPSLSLGFKICFHRAINTLSLTPMTMTMIMMFMMMTVVVMVMVMVMMMMMMIDDYDD